MAVFDFQALNGAGKKVQGTLEAETVKAARQQLRERQLTVLAVTPSKAAAAGGKQARIKTADLALMTRQLATLVSASLPLEEALRAVAQQSEKKALSQLVSQLRESVLEGHSLADALGRFPRIFDRLFCSMVAAGEVSGSLANVLNRLADHTESTQQMKSKLIQSMVYPIVLTLVAVGVVTTLLAAVVPKVVAQFVHMKQELPFTTQLLINISDFIRGQGIWIVLLLLVIGVVIRYWLRDPNHRKQWHQKLLHLPVIGGLSRGLNTARYARTLSILNSSAVPLLEAMRISADVLSNDYAREQFTLAMEKVREGSGLSQALGDTRLLPPMMRHMIASGESSGELNDMLDHAAKTQEQAFNGQISVAMSLFEPLLVISMASIVLFIILAILQPILQLNSMVG